MVSARNWRVLPTPPFEPGMNVDYLCQKCMKLESWRTGMKDYHLAKCWRGLQMLTRSRESCGYGSDTKPFRSRCFYPTGAGHEPLWSRGRWSRDQDFIRTSMHHESNVPYGVGAIPSEMRLTAQMSRGIHHEYDVPYGVGAIPSEMRPSAPMSRGIHREYPPGLDSWADWLIREIVKFCDPKSS